MKEFLNRLTNINALNRLGNRAYLALVISACALLPGLMMMLDGSQLLIGLLLVLFSVALAITALLPAWRTANNRSNDAGHELKLNSGDEFHSLRVALKTANQSQAVNQLNALNEMRNDLRRILEQKFHVGELTFNRYLDSAERVYAIVLANIESIAIAARPADSTNAIPTHTQRDEEIADLLDSNEEALKSLARVISNLSAIKTRNDKTAEPREMNEAVKDLDELAHRSDRYHKG